MIVFKRIKYKNFLSSGNTPIEVKLNISQTTLIVGSNGSGKSTLLDAICFALFNKPFRIIKKEQIINSINQSDCMVELEFDVGTKQYLIRRGIKPNVFEIFCNGKLVNQDASNIDYQKYLEQNIMRLNYRSFLQVVMLGSSSYEPFMKMKPRYRREVVEEILDIRVFGLMDLILRSQQSELQKKVLDVRHSCELIETKYSTELKYFNSLKEQGNDAKSHKQSQLDKNEKDKLIYEKKIQDLNEQIAVSQNNLKYKDQAKDKLNKLSKLEAKIEQNLSTHQKNLEFFEENDNCPTCTQKLEPTFRGEKIAYEKGKLTTLNDGMKQLVKEISNAEEKVNEFEKISQKIYSLQVDLSKVQTSLENLKTYSDSIHEELKMLSSKSDNTEKVEQQLDQLKIDLKEAKDNLIKVEEEKKYVDILREILNDKGAKAQIIKKYVPIMNTLINKYLQSMDFFISFHLDEEFNETVKSRFRDTFNYNNFSEGEKMRIDLALLFTWRDIARMKNSTNTNLLLLDEIFDGSLDGQGTDDFFKIVKNLTKENIFIISHKGDILFDKFTNIIKYEKVQNFTRLQNV